MQGYDGPLQFLTSPNNPDQILPLSTPTTPINEDGEWNKEENIKLLTVWAPGETGKFYDYKK